MNIIQCKRWSRHKTIPEAAIFQLFGSCVSYYVEKWGYLPSDFDSLYRAVQPYIYSTTEVNQGIRDIALLMGIKIEDSVRAEDWPMIKCNIAADGERIFHLPMDQQYDRVKLLKRGECYVDTVAEAEALGFRRAKRWRSGDAAIQASP